MSDDSKPGLPYDPNLPGPLADARRSAEEHGVGSYVRHIFLCTGPDCCTSEQGAAAWAALKSGVAQLNRREGCMPIYRTKVGCLRICTQGPTAVVYPEGTWYAGLDPHGLRRVVEEDLGKGRPVEDRIIGNNPLPSPPLEDIP